MRVCHIADVHVKSLQRHDEMRAVVDAFCNDVTKRGGTDRVYVGGDTFHTKTQGITPEAIDLMSWMLLEMRKIPTPAGGKALVDLILGNHDFIQMNRTRGDIMSSIVKLINDPAVTCYKHSGVYPIAPGINYCLFSIFDEDWDAVKPVPGEINIALYHGPVNGAVMESTDWKVDSGLEAGFFSEFDLCMLGDLHTPQFLGKKKTLSGVERDWIAYPGSFLQGSYAEVLKHGYLQWDIGEKGEWDVEFRELPNPKPFITVKWLGTVEDTVNQVTPDRRGARLRIHSDSLLMQSDIVELQSQLKGVVSELTFKSEKPVENVNTVLVEGNEISKADLHNVSVLQRLVEDYHKNADVPGECWVLVNNLLKEYIADVGEDASVARRNVKWSLKHLKFDNMFCYGENNVINFEKMSGICGLLGPNRYGKSSVIGTIMQSIFNTSDRGSLVNLHVPNVRKQYCSSQAIVDIDGVDHVIKRKIEKFDKKDRVLANASLDFYKVTDVATPLSEEQRAVTEKVIRSLLGTSDDCMLMSVCAQDEMNRFIKSGATYRNQVFSRMLELDVVNKMYDRGHRDLNAARTVLKSMPDCDWETAITTAQDSIDEKTTRLSEIAELVTAREARAEELRTKIASFGEIVVVTKQQVDKRREIVESNKVELIRVTEELATLHDDVASIEQKLQKIATLEKENDAAALNKKHDRFVELKNKLTLVSSDKQRSEQDLTRYKHSLTVLQQTPCKGEGEFGSCTFISDAKQDTAKIDAQDKLVKTLVDSFDIITKDVEAMHAEQIKDTLDKLNKLSTMKNDLIVKMSLKKSNISKSEVHLDAATRALASREAELLELEQQYARDDNATVNNVKQLLTTVLADIKSLNDENVSLARDVAKLEVNLEKLKSDKEKRAVHLQKMQAYELISRALSKKGVPRTIMRSQLPVINAEISEILRGIVNFNVRLEIEDDSDSLDIYLDYDNSLRPIELGSGMEKMVASLAIRVAMVNVSTLPKPDFFIIDEGFNALDDANAEAVNRLLTSMKKYFRLILLVTHVESVKDCVDNVIEITQIEKDSKIVYE